MTKDEQLIMTWGVALFLALCVALFLALCSAAFAQAQGATQTATLSLQWQDNSSNEDGFNIERGSTLTGPFVKVGSVAANVVKFADTIANDTGGVQYCYRVQGFNKAGVSPYSNVACGTSPTILLPPGTPTNLNVSVTVTVTTGP